METISLDPKTLTEQIFATLEMAAKLNIHDQLQVERLPEELDFIVEVYSQGELVLQVALDPREERPLSIYYASGDKHIRHGLSENHLNAVIPALAGYVQHHRQPIQFFSA